MPELSIRQATAADAPAIVALIDRHVATGALLPRSRDFVAERAIDYLVAVREGRLVGCVHLSEYSPSLAEVRSLATDESEPDVADQLLDAVEQLARRRDHATLFTVTNDVARFARRGYRPSEVPELYPERDEVARFAGVCTKDL